MEPASGHASSAKNFEVVSRFVDNFFTHFRVESEKVTEYLCDDSCHVVKSRPSEYKAGH
jgi:hypothetical protein